MKYIVRKTKIEDCLDLSQRLRDDDKREIWSAGRFTPIKALTEGFEVSGDYCYTLILSEPQTTHMSFDKIVGIFGVSKVQDNTGIVWLMGSDEMTKYKKGFYKVSKEYLKLFLKEFKTVFNYVDERNKTTSKWLQRLGFKLIKREPKFGEDKIPFNLFLKGR
tara:strand:+ start:788 stop:1273 length:486 start_codon:yes stop_codon:yes gene_type:complete